MKSVREGHGGFSRRLFIGTAAGVGTTLGAASLGDKEPPHFRESLEDLHPKPIPVGFGPFSPFGIFIHHKPPTPGIPLADMNEPSQITDFKGFVGITRIRGGGIGRNVVSGLTMDLAFSADMGFSQGEFIGADGRRHTGTFAFV
jgi:hypothetical protein